MYRRNDVLKNKKRREAAMNAEFVKTYYKNLAKIKAGQVAKQVLLNPINRANQKRKQTKILPQKSC